MKQVSNCAEVERIDSPSEMQTCWSFTVSPIHPRCHRRSDNVLTVTSHTVLSAGKCVTHFICPVRLIFIKSRRKMWFGYER